MSNFFSFLDALREQMRVDNKKGNRVLAKNEFRASEVASCSRKLYFKRTLEPEVFDDETVGRFALGTIIHEYVENMLKRTQSYLSSERKIEYHGKITISGHFDLMLYDEEGTFLVDVKSTSPFAWKYVENEPKAHHRVQMNTYLGILGLKRGYILPINKNEFKTFLQEVHYDDELYGATIAKLENVFDHLVAKTIPDCDNEEWECRYCYYREACKNAGK